MNKFSMMLIAVVSLAIACDDPVPQVTVCPKITSYFSPRGGCERAVVDAIDNACESVYVMAYSFTSRRIQESLSSARRRGLAVVVVADDSNSNPDHSVCDELDRDNVAVWLDAKHAIMHSKVMTIDGRIVIMGSYNWTNAAEKSNAESLLIIEDATLARACRDNFETHRQHSRRL